MKFIVNNFSTTQQLLKQIKQVQQPEIILNGLNQLYYEGSVNGYESQREQIEELNRNALNYFQSQFNQLNQQQLQQAMNVHPYIRKGLFTKFLQKYSQDKDSIDQHLLLSTIKQVVLSDLFSKKPIQTSNTTQMISTIKNIIMQKSSTILSQDPKQVNDFAHIYYKIIENENGFHLRENMIKFQTDLKYRTMVEQKASLVEKQLIPLSKPILANLQETSSTELLDIIIQMGFEESSQLCNQILIRKFDDLSICEQFEKVRQMIQKRFPIDEQILHKVRSIDLEQVGEKVVYNVNKELNLKELGEVVWAFSSYFNVKNFQLIQQCLEVLNKNMSRLDVYDLINMLFGATLYGMDCRDSYLQEINKRLNNIRNLKQRPACLLHQLVILHDGSREISANNLKKIEVQWNLRGMERRGNIASANEERIVKEVVGNKSCKYKRHELIKGLYTVDILLEDKVIVEVDSHLHDPRVIGSNEYKYGTTIVRERILEKWGYSVLKK